MKNFRQIIYVIVVVVVFLVLAVVAAVEYGGDEASRENAKQERLYTEGKKMIESVQVFLTAWQAKREIRSNDASSSKDDWAQKIEDYIEISRQKEGLTIILRNSKGEIFNKILPMLGKNNE